MGTENGLTAKLSARFFAFILSGYAFIVNY